MYEAAQRNDIGRITELLAQGVPADPVPPTRPTRKEQFQAFADSYGFAPEQLEEHRDLIEQEMDAALASGTWGAPEPEPESALCVAVHNLRLPIIFKLLSGGANANRSHSKAGRTPFHDAVDVLADGSAEEAAIQPVVFALTMAGGNPDAIPHVDPVWLKGNALPATPVQYAKQKKQHKLAEIMQAAASRTTREQRNTAAERVRTAEKAAADLAALETFDHRASLLSPDRVEQVNRRLSGDGVLPTPVYSVGREPTFTPFGLDHALRDGSPQRKPATLIGTFDAVRNSPTVNISTDSVTEYGRGRATPLDLSASKSKIVMNMVEREGSHPAAADGRWAPDDATRQELREMVHRPTYGSQLRHVLMQEVQVEEVNHLGERSKRSVPVLAVQEQAALSGNSIVGGD